MSSSCWTKSLAGASNGIVSLLIFYLLELLFHSPAATAEGAFKEHPAVQLSFVDPDFLSDQPPLTADEKPNFLVFIADDLGYGDLSIYGHPTQPVGPLDELAEKGIRFAQLYADSVCTPSRTQFLTGRLGVRTGMTGGNREVEFFDSGGLPESEITIPELLKSVGYATGINGKWHLGINCQNNTDGCHLPFQHGFDFVGTYFPTSNNQDCDTYGRYGHTEPRCNCMLYKGKKKTPQQTSVYRENLTETLIAEAKDFITKNREQPWLFEFASPQVHQPVFSSNKFKGSTIRGPYGDAVAEMSWAAGELVNHLAKVQLIQKTLFLFFSDNGALGYDAVDAGCNGLLRGTKGSTWEGGLRVPGFAWWPETIPPNVISHDVLSTADFFPTMANLAGVSMPNDIIYDGVDISPVLLGTSESKLSVTRPIYYYCSRKLMAVRYGAFKQHYWTFKNFPGLTDDDLYSKSHARPDVTEQRYWMLNCSEDRMDKHDPPLLYNLNSDPSEVYPLISDEYPGLLERFEKVIEDHMSNLKLADVEQVGHIDEALHPSCAEDLRRTTPVVSM